MEFVLNYWHIILAAIAAVVAGIVLIVRFAKKPAAEQVAKVKEWLLWAVLSAEKEFGSGTGKLKLRSVYDLFASRFPWVAKVVSFATFCGWVDEALDTVEDWLTDGNIAEYIENE